MYAVTVIGDSRTVTLDTMQDAYGVARSIVKFLYQTVQVVNLNNGRHVYVTPAGVSVYVKDGQEDASKLR